MRLAAKIKRLLANLVAGIASKRLWIRSCGGTWTR